MIQRDYPRMMLHAKKLTIRLPSGDELTLEAPVPESFSAVLDAVAGTDGPDRTNWTLTV